MNERLKSVMNIGPLSEKILEICYSVTAKITPSNISTELKNRGCYKGLESEELKERVSPALGELVSKDLLREENGRYYTIPEVDSIL